MDAQPGQLALEEEPQALTVAALYRQVQAAMTAAFPRQPPTVGAGRDPEHHRPHRPLLHRPRRPRRRAGARHAGTAGELLGPHVGPVRESLSRQGIVLEPGTVVSLQGRVEFYQPRGQVNFIATDVDVTALLGRLAARRTALLETLRREGLLERNQALAVPEVALRIGLIASTGSEGFNDFVGQLRASAFAFSVVLFRANVQGANAPMSITRALRALGSSDCTLGVLVRGGGSRGDLVAFDAEPVARAIGALPMPLWTGIGHTGDMSVADLVANRAFVTPTACGQEFVHRVAMWWEEIAGSGAHIARRAATVIEAAEQRDAAARGRLTAGARNQLVRHGERVERRALQVATQARRRLDVAADAVELRSLRIGPGARRALDRHDDRTAGWRRLLAAYDVDRQLATATASPWAPMAGSCGRRRPSALVTCSPPVSPTAECARSWKKPCPTMPRENSRECRTSRRGGRRGDLRRQAQLHRGQPRARRHRGVLRAERGGRR